MDEWPNQVTVSENAPSAWGISVLPNGRLKTRGGLVAFIDGRRAYPWRRVRVGEMHHITARNRRTPRDVVRLLKGYADRLKVAFDALFTEPRLTEQNLISRWSPKSVPEDVCIHGQDGDWHGIAGDFLPCECCGGPVSVLGLFTPPPICDDCEPTPPAEEAER